MAECTPWRVFPIVVFQAMHLVKVIQCEWYSIQVFTTFFTVKTVRMETFSSSTQYLITEKKLQMKQLQNPSKWPWLLPHEFTCSSVIEHMSTNREVTVTGAIPVSGNDSYRTCNLLISEGPNQRSETVLPTGSIF